MSVSYLLLLIPYISCRKLWLLQACNHCPQRRHKVTVVLGKVNLAMKELLVTSTKVNISDCRWQQPKVEISGPACIPLFYYFNNIDFKFTLTQIFTHLDVILFLCSVIRGGAYVKYLPDAGFQNCVSEQCFSDSCKEPVFKMDMSCIK